jgi:hypothetical protein
MGELCLYLVLYLTQGLKLQDGVRQLPGVWEENKCTISWKKEPLMRLYNTISYFAFGVKSLCAYLPTCFNRLLSLMPSAVCAVTELQLVGTGVNTMTNRQGFGTR